VAGGKAAEERCAERMSGDWSGGIRQEKVRKRTTKVMEPSRAGRVVREGDRGKLWWGERGGGERIKRRDRRVGAGKAAER